MPITILLVDDHPLFRKGLRLLFDEERDMKVVGEAGDGEEAISRVRELSPDVVVMDISMPGLNGIEATRQILTEAPETKVLALSIQGGKQFVKDMLEAGAAGYILKDSVPEELTDAVRKVRQGKVWLSSAVTEVVVSGYLELLSDEQEEDGETVDSEFTLDELKFLKPSVVSDVVNRPRLFNMLDSGSKGVMTLISAPAGYGKSVLVRSWLETSDKPTTWLTIDENIADLNAFVNYFITAVRVLFPKACPATYTFVKQSGHISAAELAIRLTKELQKINAPFIFVLDDYGFIHDADTHELLDFLIKNRVPNLQLVITTRRNPPLSLASLRAQGDLIDIRLADLKFTKPEIMEFFTAHNIVQMDDKALTRIFDITEGWPVALRLLRLNLEQDENPVDFLRNMHGDSRDIHEFLVTEVLSRQSPEMRNCLLKTSILNNFNASLCNALCGDSLDGETFIQQIISSNIFCISSDNKQTWVRYHQLFRTLLQLHLERRYDRDEIRELQIKASEWFELNNHLEESVQFALKADDTNRAIGVIVRHKIELTADEQWPIIAKLLSLLPDTIIDQTPDLLILYCRSLNKKGLYTEWIQKLDHLEQLLNNPEFRDGERNRRLGEIFSMRSSLTYHAGQGHEALQMANSALQLLPPEYISERVYALLIKAVSLQMVGEQQEAYDLVHRELNINTKISPTYHGRLLQALCFMQWVAADMHALKRSATAMFDLCHTHNIQETKVFAHYFKGAAHYQLNELDESEHAVNPVVEEPYGPNFYMFIMCVQVLAHAYESRGHSDAARELADSLLGRILKGEGLSFLSNTQALSAELEFRQDNHAQAIHWLNEIKREEAPAGYHFMIPDITIARILLRQNTEASLKQVDELLLSLHEYFCTIHCTRFIIEVLTLQALLAEARNLASAADEKMTEALTLAEPGGCLRVFIDQGPATAKILKRLARTKLNPTFIQKLLTAFDDCESGSKEQPAHEPSPNPSLLTSHRLPHDSNLSNREFEILTMLVMRLRNKEIAEKLFISSDTVKRHTINIYQKLGVHNRQEAVTKAISLNIIPQA